MRRTLLVVGGLLGGVVLFSVLAYTGIQAYSLHKWEARCRQIADWAGEPSMIAGAYVDYRLPASLAKRVGVRNASFVKTSSGDVFVLIKTHVGWKGNYEGVFYSTRPLSMNKSQKDSYGRDVIGIPNIDSELPVIERAITPQFFLVYCDLG